MITIISRCVYTAVFLNLFFYNTGNTSILKIRNSLRISLYETDTHLWFDQQRINQQQQPLASNSVDSSLFRGLLER